LAQPRCKTCPQAVFIQEMKQNFRKAPEKESERRKVKT
jgi:hypothetical protein